MSHEPGCSFSFTTGAYVRARATSASEAGAADALGAQVAMTSTARAAARRRVTRARTGALSSAA